MNKPTAISLFSGMGGDTLGMERAGFDVIAFNEFDKAGIITHQTNFPNSVLIQDETQKREKDKTNIQKIIETIITFDESPPTIRIPIFNCAKVHCCPLFFKSNIQLAKFI